jgi:hypothetical protein
MSRRTRPEKRLIEKAPAMLRSHGALDREGLFNHLPLQFFMLFMSFMSFLFGF